ncbi:CBS domain-containing protein [Aestuariivirga sp.]|uniref:CBS domain-containing protein n=1 Tax=Aestuariivirga sp. TaxID=2650926 RepID=UPI00391BC596
MAVAHILRQKGSAVITVSPEDNVQTIVDTLARHRIGAVVVVDGSGAISGIVSERDVVRAMAGSGAGVLNRKAREIMTAKVRTCSPSDSEAELMQLMTENRIRHLPVVANGKLAGMVSIGDVVKLRIESIEREAEEMKTYIASAG